jgi:hypothetical protein
MVKNGESVKMTIDTIQCDLTAYEQRDNSNYYGRLVRLQATAFSHLPALLEVALAAHGVREAYEDEEDAGNDEWNDAQERCDVAYQRMIAALNTLEMVGLEE